MRTPLLFCLLTYFTFFNYAHAVLTIDIIGGKEEGGQPIAIVPFQLKTGKQPPPQNIPKIISNNLYRSGRFTTLPTHLLPQQPAYPNQIHFQRWQAIGIPFIVIGRIKGNAKRGYIIEFELLDMIKRRQMIGYRYFANTQNLRQVAHQISDKIYQALTGEQGIFSTWIVYVTSQRIDNKTQYQLYLADADGANPRLMLKSAEPIFSPTWSPNGQQIAYVTYDTIGIHKRMAIYIQEIRTGHRTLISAKPGLNTAPAWSPDGTRLAFTLSQSGNPEIYILHLPDQTLKRITYHRAIDTEPEWSPDSKHLVFTSDRSGQPHIYRISIDGGKVQRLTFEGQYNARPRFSPDGSKLAILHSRHGKGHHIAVFDLNTKKLKILTQSTLDESPSFAPNGSMILYTTGSELAAVSIDGRIHQRLKTDINQKVREPAWSPFLSP